MNGTTRKKLYKRIAERDGEYCRGCQALPSERPLVLDHIDNYNSNRNNSNFQLLCRRCNYLKNPRGPVDLCVNRSVIDGRVTEVDINRRMEPLFRKFAYHLVNEYSEVPQNDIINSGAEEVGISPVTAKRYLDKMCSGRGIFERENRVKTVVIRYKRTPLGL